jgi:hypothetical protein
LNLKLNDDDIQELLDCWLTNHPELDAATSRQRVVRQTFMFAVILGVNLEESQWFLTIKIAASSERIVR